MSNITRFLNGLLKYASIRKLEDMKSYIESVEKEEEEDEIQLNFYYLDITLELVLGFKDKKLITVDIDNFDRLGAMNKLSKVSKMLHREDESKLKSDKGDGALFLASVVNHINTKYSPAPLQWNGNLSPWWFKAGSPCYNEEEKEIVESLLKKEKPLENQTCSIETVSQRNNISNKNFLNWSKKIIKNYKEKNNITNFSP